MRLNITNFFWDKNFSFYFFVLLSVILFLVGPWTKGIIEMSGVAISVLITINVFFLIASGAMLSNIESISLSPVVEWMKKCQNKDGVSRYEELFMIIQRAELFNLLSFSLGFVLLANPICAGIHLLQAMLISLGVVSLFSFYLAIRLMGAVLRNID